MSIVNDFLAARAAFDAGKPESIEAFDSAVQSARDAGYVVSVPEGDISRARISETGKVETARVFVKDPAPSSPTRKRLFIKEKSSDDQPSSDEA